MAKNILSVTLLIVMVMLVLSILFMGEQIFGFLFTNDGAGIIGEKYGKFAIYPLRLGVDVLLTIINVCVIVGGDILNSMIWKNNLWKGGGDGRK